MSRCFPFPPPGYENKARSDHVDLPKHKEKKHKKEKRDREKRESKEKKEKDRSKDKHREKKERKGKDEKKDNNHDANESRVPEDRKIDESSEGHHGVKLGDGSQRTVDAMDTQFTARIKIEEKGKTNSVTKNFTNFTDSLDVAFGKEKEKFATNGKVPISIPTLRLRIDEVDRPYLNGTAIATGNGASTNNLVLKPFGSSNMAANLNGTATTIGNGRAATNNLVPNFSGKEQRINNGIGRPNGIGFLEKRESRETKEKDRSKDKHREKKEKRKDEKKDNNRDANESRVPEDRKIDEDSDGVKLGDSSQRTVDAMDNQLTARIKNEGKGTTNSVTKNFDSLGAAVGKEKEKVTTNGKVPISVPTLRLRIDGVDRPCLNGTAIANGNGRASTNNLVQKPIRSSNTVANLNVAATAVGNGRAATNNLVQKPVPNFNGKEQRINNGIGRPNGMAMQEINNFSKDNSEYWHGKEHSSSVVTNGSIKKRKDFEKKDFPHEEDARPSKFPRATNSSSHISLTLEHKMNGVTLHHPSLDSKPPSIEKKIPSKKRVHRDIKYLSKIYSIPDTEELPDSNEEWLFIGDKPKTKPEAEGTPQVWAEAMKIDSDDVIALPYVVPF